MAKKGCVVIMAVGYDAADVSIFDQFGVGGVLNSMDVRVNLLSKPL